MPTFRDGQSQEWSSAAGQLIPSELFSREGMAARFGARWIGEFSSFANAISTLSPLGKQTLDVTTLQTLTAAVDVPNNITLRMYAQGGFTSSAAQTLTIRGAIVAAPVQVFFGAVAVNFIRNDNNVVNTRLGEVFAEWWGALGDGNTDDTNAFNAALAACKTSFGIALRLLARPYRASVTIPTPAANGMSVAIIGSGDASSIVSRNAAESALKLDVTGFNVNLLLRDFALRGRSNHTVPVLMLKTPGGVDGRLFGRVDNVKAIGDGVLSDCVYIKGGLALDIEVRTEGGRYSLYHEDSSNSIIRIHAGNATCNGVMIKGGGNNGILRARIEDSAVANLRAIASINGNGATITVVTTLPHGMEALDRVTITGAGGFNFSTPRRVTVVNATTFTYAGSESGSGAAGSVRISSAVLRIKDSGTNQFYDIANESKDGVDYCLVIQSTGDQVTGGVNASFNIFNGGIYGAIPATGRNGIATMLIEGPCHSNQFYGVTLGKSSGLNAANWDVLLEGNESNVRPRLNKFIGSTYVGTGNTGTMRLSEPIPGAFGNRFLFAEPVAERTHTFGDRYEPTADATLERLQAGAVIHNRGAAGVLTITLFPAVAGLEPLKFVNTNDSFAFRFKPAAGQKIAGRAANKYCEIPVGGSATVSCSVDGILEIQASNGALTFEA